VVTAAALGARMPGEGFSVDQAAEELATSKRRLARRLA
jgi:hypothetical protein